MHYNLPNLDWWLFACLHFPLYKNAIFLNLDSNILCVCKIYYGCPQIAHG